jgi:hypothetical protein
MSDQNLLPRAPPCFRRHVKPLVSAALQSLVSTPVSRRDDVRQAASRKNKCRIFITTWWKHVVPTPLSGIRVGRRRVVILYKYQCSYDYSPTCTGTVWWVISRSPLCAIHKEGLCLINGDINRLMIMMMIRPRIEKNDGHVFYHVSFLTNLQWRIPCVRTVILKLRN